MALEIVSLVSRNKECVSEIAACEILGHFLVALRDTELKEMQDRVLETLSGLLNVQKMVKEAQSKGNKQTTNFTLFAHLFFLSTFRCRYIFIGCLR